MTLGNMPLEEELKLRINTPASISATRILEFDAGHRLLRHESKCAMVHGHRYRAEVFCVADELDQVGRVVDFGVIKAEVGKWIDDNWDHGFIVYTADERMINFLIEENQKRFELLSEPTAENMALFLLKKANTILESHGVRVVKVKLWETPNCYATTELLVRPFERES